VVRGDLGPGPGDRKPYPSLSAPPPAWTSTATPLFRQRSALPLVSVEIDHLLYLEGMR